MSNVLIRLAMIALAACASIAPLASRAETTIQVLYASPNIYQPVFDKITREFEVKHPDIKVKFWMPAANYDEAIPQILRGAVTGKLPDVFFTGFNYLRVLKDRNLLVPLEQFVSGPDEWNKLGYLPPMLSLSELEKNVWGLPFAISIPIVYVNEDLIKRAGGSIEGLPKDWRGLAELGQKINALDPGLTGFWFPHSVTGNFGLQQLIDSAGGEMGSENGCELRFDQKPGQWALETLEMFHSLGMPAYSQTQAQQAFAAGTVGIYVSSTALTRSMEKAAAGRFSFHVLSFPQVSGDGHLPAGGSVGVMMAKDKVKQEAAWEFLKHATGPIGQTDVATLTGYLPANQQALDDPKLLGTTYVNAPNNRAGLKQLSIVHGWYNWGGANSVKIVDVINNYTTAIASGRQSAADAMTAMKRDVKALLVSCEK